MVGAALIGPRDRQGGNNPPPIVTISDCIDALHETVASITAITDEDQARDVAETIAEIRAAEKQADDERTAQKAPHLSAGRAVDAAWKPVIDKAGRAKNAALAAQTVWLKAQEAARERREAIARHAADAMAEAARKAHAAANPADLEQVEAAEAALEQARKADAAANAVAAARTTAKGYGDARAVGLRTYYRADVTDPAEFARYLWRNHNAEYLVWLATVAARMVAADKCNLPGVIAVAEQRAA